jgi:uncharacterized protein YcgI (DUF1989 family)
VGLYLKYINAVFLAMLSGEPIQFVIPACEARAFLLKKGRLVRIVEVEGKQVADVAIFNADDYSERFDSSQTVFLNAVQGIGNIKRISKLYSAPPRENVMLTVTDDKVGVHFPLLGGKCTRNLYAIRDGIVSHRNCQENLAEALGPYGLGPHDVGDVFNVFMNVEITNDGKFEIRRPVSEKGDYIEMRAELNCLIAISACPGDTAPTNDFKPKSLGVEIR